MRVHDCLSESMLEIAEFSETSDPSEDSSLRDVRGRAIPLKVVPSECSMEQLVSPQEKMMNSNNIGLKFIQKNCVPVDSETAFRNGNPSATDSLNSPERNVYMKYNAQITNAQEPPLAGQTMTDNDGSNELIDVRVCDICGDVGRELLLALCSKCSDGAEHIYCMRIKMDKVPEGDWLCEDCASEDCTMIEEPERLKQIEVGEMRMDHSGKDSCLYSTRLGSDVEVSPTLKRRRLEISGQPVKTSRRILEISDQPVKSTGSVGKVNLTRVSSLRVTSKEKELVRPVIMVNEAARRAYSMGDQSANKILEHACTSSEHKSRKPMCTVPERKALLTGLSSLKVMDKGKGAIHQLSPCSNGSAEKRAKQPSLSPCHRSPKPQYQFHGGDGDLCKTKSNNVSESKVQVQQSHKNVNPERRISKESFERPSKMKRPEKKLFKSMSVSGVCTVPANISDSFVSHASNVKDLKYSGGRNSTEKYDSVENKSLVQGSPVTDSGEMKVDASRTTLSSEIVKAPSSLRNNVQNMESIQANENSNVKDVGAVTYEGRSSSNTLGRSMGENISSSRSNCRISSSTTNMDSYPDGRRSECTTPKVKLQCSSKADNALLVASSMVPSDDSHLMKELPIPVVLPGISAVPQSECCWKGAFELEEGGKLPKNCSGIQAHISTCASSHVLEQVRKFHSKILFKEVSRLDIWPIQFHRNHPMEQDIAVYFFAEDLPSYSRSYKVLLDGMARNDLALEANFGEVQFLVFLSRLLPARLQRWNSLSFLWGVFRLRKVDNGSSDNPYSTVATLKQRLGSGDQMSLQSSASTKTMDHNGEHDVSSRYKCFTSHGLPFGKPYTSPVADDWTEKESLSGGVLHSDDFQKGDGHINQFMRSFGKTQTLPCDQLDQINMVSLALDSSQTSLCSYGNHRLPLPKLLWSYDYFSKLWQEKRLDVVSWSSVSVDSGPSGSSDGGGCAKSDEGQVEQLRTLANHRDLNLDLCLGSGSEADGQVELDLVLGFAGTSNNRVKQGPKDGSAGDGNVSLDLSLWMPYSNS